MSSFQQTPDLIKHFMLLTLALSFLTSCHSSPQSTASYASPHVTLPEVSSTECLSAQKLQQRLNSVEPSVQAERFTTDVSVELAPDACPGADARLRQGSLRLRRQPLSEIFSADMIDKQIKCDTFSAQTADAEGNILHVKWLSPQSLEVRRRFQAVNLRRPRLEKNLKWNGHVVEVTEIVRWGEGIHDDARFFPVSRTLLQSLEGELMPLEVSLRLSSQTTDNLRLPVEEYARLTQIPLKNEWHICEPYHDPATPPPEVPPEN